MHEQSRVDCLLIWGHGVSQLDNILTMLRGNRNFLILKIVRHKARSISSLVKTVYSFDYAPIWHLRSKTKYLKKTQRTVFFVFFRNTIPNEQLFDSGRFQHLESKTVKEFKEAVRDRYNPYKNGKRTHEHVVHATDSESQAADLLIYLGFNQGVEMFRQESSVISLPYYLEVPKRMTIRNVSISQLFCSVVEGPSWDKYKITSKLVKDSPQYKGISEDMRIYEDYINKYRGGALQEDYSTERYLSMKSNFSYLEHPNELSYILVREIDNRMTIVDGLHRASVALNLGLSRLAVCQLVT